MTTLTQRMNVVEENLQGIRLTLDTLLQNLLNPALMVPGTLRFGGNRMQLDNLGIQLGSPDDNNQGIWLVSRLTQNPADEASHVLISGTINSTTSTFEISSVLSGSSGPSIKLQNNASEFWTGIFDAPFLVPSLSADPTILADGLVWYRDDLDEFRGRVNGVTKTFTLA